MNTYDTDVVAWAARQAQLLRARRFDELDVENVAEEIEDVGKSEQRELASRMAVLLAHLLKWQFQPERRGKSWERSIVDQRRLVRRRLGRTPSLRPMLVDPEWQDDMWADAVAQATKDTGLEDWPEHCAWSFEDVLGEGWLPDDQHR